MIQKDKMDAIDNRGLTERDAFFKENRKQQALSAIRKDGEKGIRAVMYDHIDNYDSVEKFIEAINDLTRNVIIEWTRDQEDHQQYDEWRDNKLVDECEADAQQERVL